MERLEHFQTIDHEVLPTANGGSMTDPAALVLQMRVLRREIVAQALKELWKEQELAGEPLLFYSPSQGRMLVEHLPLLLDRAMESTQPDQTLPSVQLVSWQRLPAPKYAHKIAQAGGALLFKADLLRPAGVDDRKVVASLQTGWLCHTFAGGWSALSVCYDDGDEHEQSSMSILVALPPGYEDEWLTFLKALDNLRAEAMRRERRGRIELIGANNNDLIATIQKTTFDDVVLPEETLAQVHAQRCIFDAEMLKRYAALRVPRLRKVLLIGPPGTGKTTLLKAEGARHAQEGGLVFFVSAAPKGRGITSWQQLTTALRGAAESRLPTLILVEDFEMFVSDAQELQLVLNTLDGVATPDNPAGTLLLATSNDPEKIDYRIRDRPGRVDLLIEIGVVEDIALAVRFLKHFLGDAYREEEHASLAPLFLKQPGSHFREVCIAGAMRALEMDRLDVLREDLLWAHEAILHGRSVASQSDRFVPPPARKSAGFFGKNRP